MRYLRGEAILIIHSEIIDTSGGRHGVRDVGLLGSIIHKPQLVLDGQEQYPTIHDKAAVYMETFAHFHVFNDGNKRTGLVTAARFLFINGWEFKASNQAAEQFIMDVATKKSIDLMAISIWLKQNSKKLK